MEQRLVERGWHPSAILFPGGYFHLPVHVGPLDRAERIRHINRQPFSEACCRVSSGLGATVVVGVDSVPCFRKGFSTEDAGDQLCVAWSGETITGLGRKIFPAPPEVEDLVIYKADMVARERLVDIGTAHRALLCSCYDMFGCGETADNPGKRSRGIRWLWTSQGELLERPAHRHQVSVAVSEGLRAWEELVQNASVGLAAIHQFARTGLGSGKAYWQRHGIERASRVIGGRAAFGAAHLEPPLPNWDVATFAAKRGRRILPTDHLYISDENGRSAALARLFRP